MKTRELLETEDRDLHLVALGVLLARNGLPGALNLFDVTADTIVDEPPRLGFDGKDGAPFYILVDLNHISSSVKAAADELRASPAFCFTYALEVLKAPWPEAEPVIATDSSWAYCYAVEVLKHRFPRAEQVIADSSNFSVLNMYLDAFASEFPDEGWPAIEHLVATDAQLAFRYLRVKPDFQPAIDAVMASAFWRNLYQKQNP